MRISSARIATFTLAATFLVSPAIPQVANVAQGASSKDTVRMMEMRYRAAKTLQATFLERYTENGRLTRVEAGTAYFLRPGKMRWEYESPEKNLFLVDGKNAWFYVPSDHTATRVPAKQSSDWRTPLALLAGEMKVSRVCARVTVTTDEKPEIAENAMLSCTLRGAQAEDAKSRAPATNGAGASSQQQTVYFEVAKSTGDLVRVLVHDPGGVGIEFHFENWRMNPPISDALFHFSAPLGVAIVNGELPATQNSVKP